MNDLLQYGVPDPLTLVEILQWRATTQPNRQAYIFLADGESQEVGYTYAELNRRAQAIAAHLQAVSQPGERALLLYPPGLEYIAAFFGCLYAGTVAVPAYPPAPNRPMPRLQAIAADAQATLLLTNATLLAEMEQRVNHIPSLQALHMIGTDTISDDLAAGWQATALSGESLAFLQYTSGSTALPKGVMVTHANLMHNQEMIRVGYQHTQESTFVTWLPIYHDMGLIGNILQTLYLGALCVLMAPVAFLQQPYRWLQAISRYQGRTSGAPNFAYDLCARKITPEQKATLDLSSWSIAFNGSEPVRKETLDRFSAAFEECGFRPEAFFPCYGLAEATLFVAGVEKNRLPITPEFQVAALEQRRITPADASTATLRPLVGCGQTRLEQTIVIANPETLTRCEDDQIGEIWIGGPSVAKGYWNRPDESQRVFQAYLADSGEGPFLRTGDLGFCWDNQLFVAGRLKNMLIMYGRNHYPQDLELTVEKSHPALRPGCGAAFSVEVDGEERLVIAQEVERSYLRKLDIDAVVGSIRSAVAEHHEVDTYAVALLRTGAILKTSSGKIQHQACKSGFLEGTLTTVGVWVQGTSSIQPAPADQPAAPQANLAPVSRAVGEIQAWLIDQIAQRQRLGHEQIDVRQPFSSYGLSSIEIVGLSGDLEIWLGRRLSPTLVYSYPTIELLARHLAGVEPAAHAPAAAPAESQQLAEPIAVIGLGCRFPGAATPTAFWDHLQQGVDSIREIPGERWNIEAFYAPEISPGTMNTRWGGFIENVDQFDPYFFGISPREAEHMDPQQRLLLEVAWESLEHAGIAPDSLAGQPVGIFIGISNNDYAHLSGATLAQANIYTGTGNALSIAANRLAYVLDLRGPALAIDTACSSSLVAVHSACQSLRLGESQLALAGGVNLILAPDISVTFSQAQMLAADGRCKTFDAAADGYVRGEGCGLVVLKRLADALAAGDPVLAVIRGSAVNQDGRSNGLTAPNGLAQQAVIRQALAQANVEPAQIQYVEAHGSGTALGDPIEIDALKAVLGAGRSEAARCWIGAVKTNIGHLEAAAGIAGLLKVVLALHHGEIPPNLHFHKLNPHIDLSDTPLAIPTERQPWPDSAARRLAGVSAFGFGGTNAHVVVEAAPPTASPASQIERPRHILALAAKDRVALLDLATSYRDLLGRSPALGLADLCFSANTGRAHFAHRLALSAATAAQLHTQLDSAVRTWTTAGSAARRTGAIAFLFTGQGSQYPQMGRQLYETQPLFRRIIDECDTLTRAYLPQSLLAALYPAADQATPIDTTRFTQPALFAVEYGLARLLQSWGIEPDVVMGHSVGEYGAACFAGVFSLEDGLRLVVERARLMQALPDDGQMVAIGAAEARVAAAIAPHAHEVALAAINGPQSCVIAGRATAVQQIGAQFRAAGCKVSDLNVSHAFHSPLMEPMLADFGATLATVTLKKPQLPIISNLTGAPAPDAMATAEYWLEHIRQPVQFARSMQALERAGCETFIEIGPDAVLLAMGRQCLPAEQHLWLPTLRKNQLDWEQLLESLVALYERGGTLDWAGFDREYPRRHGQIPTYPWRRQRYWRPTESAQPGATSRRPHGPATHPLLGERLPDLAAASDTAVWQVQLDSATLDYLGDHRVAGAVIVPVAVYVEMARKAAQASSGITGHVISNLALHTPLFIHTERPHSIQLTLAGAAKQKSFYVHGRADDHAQADWVLHASAEIVPGTS